MVWYADGIIAIGVFGLWIATAGATGAAWLVETLRSPGWRRRAHLAGHPKVKYRVDILIAARNEESLIETTLSSLPAGPDVRIVLGLDHCTDGTERIASAWAKRNDAQLIIETNPSAPSKWNTLVHLVNRSEADWVALVDAGSVWKEGLLEASHPYLTCTEVIGVAPSYGLPRESLVDRLTWGFERFLKSVESRAGGPTSVHGATVLYRRAFLLMALEELGDRVWLNDDVVIPLTFRTLWPRFRIHYLTAPNGGAWVRDFGSSVSKKSEIGRRERMLIGNLQWIRSLYGRALKSDPVVALIASRRAFRALWAYWVLAIVLGTVLGLGFALRPPILAYIAMAALALIAVSLPLRGGVAKLRSAFFAGLEVPFLLTKTSSHVTEKIWN